MNSLFFGTGNLGADPIVRDVPVDGGGTTKVVNLRVRFDRPRPKKDGGYEDKGGFWADVALFGNRAEPLSKLLHKGARVAVLGELYQDEYEKDEESRTALAVTASFVGPDPIAIESVTFRSRTRVDEMAAAEEEVAA